MTLQAEADEFEHAVRTPEDYPSDSFKLKGRARRERLRLPLLTGVVVIAIALALFFYLRGGRYESTDNAYLQSGLVSISPNISGPVVAVEVHENQHVRAGQLLFRIDPTPFALAVDEAAAALESARTQVRALRANYREGQAAIGAARDRLAFAVRESARQKALLAEGISSQAQYDQAVLAERTARQGVMTAEQQNASVAASLSGNLDGPIDVHPLVQKARAAFNHAKVNLSYTEVRAPQDGIVTKVNQLQVGDYVSASRPVFTLAGTHIWVEANFKESQLDHMRVGQPATFEVDAFPDLKLKGHLVSFSPGTGNSFALLPAENATGNWVKVVQRLTVQFEIDNVPPDVPLHTGLSVEVTVDTGHRRHLSGGAN
jgi:membrane fusion protein, multidrug efflux system